MVEKYSGHPMINQALFSLQCFFQEFSMVYIQAWKILNDIYIADFDGHFLHLMITSFIILALLAQIFPPLLSYRARHYLYFIYLYLPCKQEVGAFNYDEYSLIDYILNLFFKNY